MDNKFCPKCGMPLNESNLCPHCDISKTPDIYKSDAQKEQLKNKIIKSKKKAKKNAAKITKWNKLSSSQKASRIAVKSISLILVIAIVLTLVLGTLVYFDVADIPIVSSAMQSIGLTDSTDKKPAVADKNKEDKESSSEIIIEPIIKEDAVYFDNHWYYIYQMDSTCTYDEAQRFCQNLGAHLATIQSEQENSYLYDYMRSQGYDSAYFGFSLNDQNNTWSWINNEPITYTNWAENEPNNEWGDEFYALYNTNSGEYTWSCGIFGSPLIEGQTNFICEWDADIDKKPYTYKPEVLQSTNEEMTESQSLTSKQDTDELGDDDVPENSVFDAEDSSDEDMEADIDYKDDDDIVLKINPDSKEESNNSKNHVKDENKPEENNSLLIILIIIAAVAIAIIIVLVFIKKKNSSKIPKTF